MKWLVLISLIFCLNFVSAFDNQTLQVCGGDSELIINCIGDDELNSLGFTTITTIGVTSGVGNPDLPRINLEKLIILNKKLCIGESKLRFKTLDTDNQFTLIDSAELYLNNTKSSNKLFLDVTNQEYYYILDLEKGEIEVKLIVNQLGKQITETKSLNIERCIFTGIQEYSKNKLNEIINFIKENQDFFIYIILILLGILILIIILYKIYKSS